jgi:peroxiredoxin
VTGPLEADELGKNGDHVAPTVAPVTVSPATVRRRPKLRLVGTLLLIALVISAIVSAVVYSHNATEASAKGSTTIGFVRLSDTKLASFQLPELNDPQITKSLANYTGKPLLINFWSSTCTICSQEAPAMASAYHQLGSQIEFVGIDTAEPSREAGISFATLHAMNYPLLFDGSAAVASRYDVPGLPVSFFVSRTGKLLGENFGALTVSSIDHLAHLLYGISPSQ